VLYPKTHTPLRISSLAIAIGLLLASTAASAQSTQDADAVDLDSISVTGVRASIQKSLVEKHSASGIVDAISAEDIGKFPDLNLSESLQRIPGVTLDRNAVGEGAQVNLRGLGPEFTQVEINGMPGLSNGGESRYSARSQGSRAFNFEMFSSELFSSAAVYKTGMAEVDEGGLAGTVRMQTPRPLDGQGTRMAASILGNYSELTDTTNPRTAVLFSHNHNDVFGITASVAWAQTDFASYEVKTSGWQPLAMHNPDWRPRASDELREALVPLGPTHYLFKEDRSTTGATLTLQVRPNDVFQLTLDGLYGKLKSDSLQHRPDYPLDQGVGIPIDPVVENGVITAATFEGLRHRNAPRMFHTDEDYNQLVLRAEWTPDEYWSIRPSLGWATREMTREFDLFSFGQLGPGGRTPFNPGPGQVRYQIRGDYIDFESSVNNFDSNPEDYLFTVFIMNPTRTKSEAKQARVDFDRHFAGHDHVLKFGLRYNETSLEHNSSEWWLSLAPGTDPASLPHMDAVAKYNDFKVRGSGPNTPSRLLGVDRNLTWETYMPGGVPLDGLIVREFPENTASNSYMIEEKTSSAWMQMDFQFASWTLIPGVRYVRTEQIANGFEVIDIYQPSQDIRPISFSKTYNGVLPSLTARYDLSSQIVLRGAYARTLTRPGLGSLAPGEALTVTGDDTGIARRGNPNLEPYYAHNFDLGAEWYFSSDGLLAANVFYKKASNFIDNQSSDVIRIFPRQTGPGLANGRVTLTEPVNGVSATIKGIELSAQSRFSRLPGAWGNLGGILNYTHTESSADFAQEGDVRSQGLPGLSENSINAILYYDDGRLDTRLSYAWRDDYLATIAEEPGGIPRFTESYGQLDLSVNWRFNEKVSLQAQILNLTREQRIDQSTARRLPYAVTEIDRRFLVGVRVAF